MKPSKSAWAGKGVRREGARNQSALRRSSMRLIVDPFQNVERPLEVLSEVQQRREWKGAVPLVSAMFRSKSTLFAIVTAFAQYKYSWKKGLVFSV